MASLKAALQYGSWPRLLKMNCETIPFAPWSFKYWDSITASWAKKVSTVGNNVLAKSYKIRCPCNSHRGCVSASYEENHRVFDQLWVGNSAQTTSFLSEKRFSLWLARSTLTFCDWHGAYSKWCGLPRCLLLRTWLPRSLFKNSKIKFTTHSIFFHKILFDGVAIS